MRFKLNKKILTAIGLSCLLVFPLVLTSCGNSKPPTVVVKEEINEGAIGSYTPPIVNTEESGSINQLYKKYGDRIYYEDQNNLWTLDLSEFHKLHTIHSFVFGLFKEPINRLILPKNPELNIHLNAFYPNTTNGHEWAKKGINPMFKAKAKPSPKYNFDKYYFELDLTNIYISNTLTKIKNNPPVQIFPIDDFEYDFTSKFGDLYSPPLPLNLWANTNYIKKFISQEKIDQFKNKEISLGEVTNYISDEFAFSFGHSPYQNKLKLYDPTGIYDIVGDGKNDSVYGPMVVSHPYLFKYILKSMCSAQLSGGGGSDFKSSNDIFSNNGNALSISFMNQFTENSDSKEIIDLALGQDAVVQILNYDFTLPKDQNKIGALDPKHIDLLIKWEKEYGMYDVRKKLP